MELRDLPTGGLAEFQATEESAEIGEHRLRFFRDIEPGEPPELVTPGAGIAFALAVLLPSVTGAVVAVAVQLDREAMLRPATVDVAAIDAPIDLWMRKAGRAKADEESIL